MTNLTPLNIFWDFHHLKIKEINAFKYLLHIYVYMKCPLALKGIDKNLKSLDDEKFNL